MGRIIGREIVPTGTVAPRTRIRVADNLIFPGAIFLDIKGRKVRVVMIGERMSACCTHKRKHVEIDYVDDREIPKMTLPLDMFKSSFLPDTNTDKERTDG